MVGFEGNCTQIICTEFGHDSLFLPQIYDPVALCTAYVDVVVSYCYRRMLLLLKKSVASLEAVC